MAQKRQGNGNMEEKVAGEYYSKRSFLSSDKKVFMFVNQVLAVEKKDTVLQGTSYAPQGCNLGSGKRQQVAQIYWLYLLIWIWVYVVKSVTL